MKTILKYLPVITFLTLALPQVASAQDIARNERKVKHNAGVEQLIESERYVFEARTVTPIGGPTRQLTTYYDLTIKGDSVISFLPYFGRSYVAPMSAADGGIRFTSTDFNYETHPRRKGGWNIKITPKDVNTVQQINLTVSANGQASLHVTSNNRQPISFMGVLRDLKS